MIENIKEGVSRETLFFLKGVIKKSIIIKK